MGSAFMHGWIALPTLGQVCLEHGIPARVWVPAQDAAALPALGDEIHRVTGLHVEFGAWTPGAQSGEAFADLAVVREEFGQVLAMLARASAETFYDRYGKAIDGEDVDYDEEAYAQDFDAALHFCSLGRDQIDQGSFHDHYLHALHDAATRISRHH